MKKLKKPDDKKDLKKPMKKLAAAVLLSGAMGCGSDTDVHLHPYLVEDQYGDCTVEIANCNSRTLDFREPGVGQSTRQVEGVEFNFVELLDRGETKDAVFHVRSCGDVIEYDVPVNTLVSLRATNAEFHVRVNTIEYDSTGLRIEATVTPVCE